MVSFVLARRIDSKNSTIFEEFIHPPVWCWAISGIFLRERRAIESILEVIFGFKLERFAH